jgi:lysophospholipid acyltransferase (LPLAT)-like uncharacterized protein
MRLSLLLPLSFYGGKRVLALSSSFDDAPIFSKLKESFGFG